MTTSFRSEDAALLERLLDEEVLERVFHHHAGVAARNVVPHPRAAGLLASLRSSGGAESAIAAARSGNLGELTRLIDTSTALGRPPELLHHLAVYFERVAQALESVAAEAAANAWMRSTAAWLALGEEGTYLERLEAAVLGKDKGRSGMTSAPEIVALRISELGDRAKASSRTLSLAGHAALLALAWVREAARISGVSPATESHAVNVADREKNAAIDDALSTVAEALDEANARGELSSKGTALVQRVVAIWAWSGYDESVEHFAVDKVATIGWELYRARSWDALRALLMPFRPMIERLAERVARDPSNVAYAAPCAQMVVFLSDVETSSPRKKELAEWALRICPGHRNARVVLASLLCDEATTSLQTMALVVRKDELARIEGLVARAESLYPQHGELEEVRRLLERTKKVRLTI